MKIRYLNVIKNGLGSLWTRRGGRPRIEASQLRHLRQLVEKVRRESPLFAELYADLPPSDEVQLADLPITRKPELMAEFDRWLTTRAVTKAQAQAHLDDPENEGVPLGEFAVVRSSGTSGYPLIAVMSQAALGTIMGAAISHIDKDARRATITAAKAMRKKGVVNISLMGDGPFMGSSLSKMVAGKNSKIGHFLTTKQPVAKIVSELNALSESGNTLGGLSTYPSMLTILLDEKAAGRLNIDPVLIKLAGETVTDQLREKVASAFPEAFMQNAYGATECGTLGIECGHGRFHSAEDWVIIEAVDENDQPCQMVFCPTAS